MKLYKKYLYIKKVNDRYSIEDASGFFGRNIRKGDTVEVVAGRKIPKGTKAVVKYWMRNKFENSPVYAISSEEFNPSVLLTLEDKSEVWTTGNNLINTNPKDAQTKVVCFLHENDVIPKVARDLCSNFNNGMNLDEAIQKFEEYKNEL